MGNRALREGEADKLNLPMSGDPHFYVQAFRFCSCEDAEGCTRCDHGLVKFNVGLGALIDLANRTF